MKLDPEERIFDIQTKAFLKDDLTEEESKIMQNMQQLDMFIWKK